VGEAHSNGPPLPSHDGFGILLGSLNALLHWMTRVNGDGRGKGVGSAGLPLPHPLLAGECCCGWSLQMMHHMQNSHHNSSMLRNILVHQTVYTTAPRRNTPMLPHT
jgi:hypothetical protein